MAGNCRQVFLLPFFFVFVVSFVRCAENYCSTNNFNTNTTNYMQFTKEATFDEFAVVGNFKALHCCAKGYRSIEWYKDDVLYPWSLSKSQLILYPEGANQTLYTKTITESDAGNYTCLLRNDSVVHKHTIHLTVFQKVPDTPGITYISSDQQVAVGQKLRLFCEAFAGQVDLPDAYNEAVWRKIGHNGTVEDGTRVQQKEVSREDGQTFGAYLIFNNVQREDFGKYSCKISKPGKTIELFVHVNEQMEIEYLNPNPVPVTKLIFFMSMIILIFLAVVLLYLKYGLPLRVRFKDSFSTIEDNDGKSIDVLICYATKDAEIVLGVLKPNLENHYQYKCASRELTSNVNMWFVDLQEPAEKARRVVVVLSPEALNNNWDTTTVLQALKQLQPLGPKVQCITLKELPTKENEIKNSQGETLASFLRIINVILWKRSDVENFWYALRLRLPPKRRNNQNIAEAKNVTSQAENSSRLTSNSLESLNSLV